MNAGKSVLFRVSQVVLILALALSASGGALAQGELPYLRAWLDGDGADGNNWPADQAVTLEVGGLIFEATAGPDGYVDFPNLGYDLVQGDTLTMSSGDAVVTYTARQLFIVDIDPGTETVSGTVDGPQTEHVFTEGGDLYGESHESGNWCADMRKGLRRGKGSKTETKALAQAKQFGHIRILCHWESHSEFPLSLDPSPHPWARRPAEIGMGRG